jgi:Holliday junction DNA helicase RuvB
MLQEGDVLFLDECHALRREMAELLYSSMEDFKISIKPESGERLIMLGLKPFTLIGATTGLGRLPEPMRARFGPCSLAANADLDNPNPCKVHV